MCAHFLGEKGGLLIYYKNSETCPCPTHNNSPPLSIVDRGIEKLHSQPQGQPARLQLSLL